ncbi:MAG: PDZ domain-containing protein [Myxococcales bacterium]|nr:PDZ domain-containing protein [Myxococcales bacterium]
MRNPIRIFLVGMAALIALGLTISRRGPAMLVGIGRTTGAATTDRKAHELSTTLDTFNKTLVRIHDAYVDPTRIDPKQMLIAALESVQKHVAEVLVEPQSDKNKVLVRVDTAAREFNIENVDAAWSLAPKMSEIFQFITQNLLPGTDAQAIRDIEYAATNGMLSTLDPHSLLLDPQTYNDMKTSTRGSFGGLGIVIGIRRGGLRVIRPMKGTPAWEAGVRRGDKIVRIEREPTDNMALQDAVDRLRGEPGTKVEIYTERDGEKGQRRLVLTRAEIQVPSVTTQLMKSPSGPVGYIRLSQFNQKSDEDVRNALDELAKKQPIRGLVLDLRGDPGGLLDKAIKIADEFLESGTIVTTVGFANKQREEKRATPAAQPHFPIAVLVDGSSASASEIVAGALKNLDRAVVIGSRTFGKGSVQVLYDNDDGSALKLTIAQYLTPGDLSIQSVGITPDIVLEPMRVEKDRLSLFGSHKGTREQDLDAHLTSQNARTTEKPLETLRYIWTDPRKKVAKGKPAQSSEALRGDPDADGDDEPADDLGPEDEDTFIEDYVIQYARDMLGSSRGWRRHELLGSARDFFGSKRSEQQARLTEALRQFGVDFSPVGPQTAPPSLEATITTDKPDNTAKAGETLTFTATVKNRGTGIAGQVRAQLKSDNFLYEELEFVFGRVAPGETRTWSIPVKVPKAVLPRQDLVRVVFSEENNQAPPSKDLQVRLQGLPRPRFAYSYQLIDDGSGGNGDGQVQRGEPLRLRVNIENSGSGRALKPVALLRNLSGEGVLVNKGRFELPEMAPKERRTVDFTFDLSSQFQESSLRVELQVYDMGMHDGVTDKLTFAINDSAVRGQETRGGFVLSTDAEIRTGASSTAPVIAQAKRGDRYPALMSYGGFLRIELEPGRPGFIAASSGQVGAPLGPKDATPLTSWVWQVTPPLLEVSQPPLSVNSDRIHLTGTARDDEQVTDAYIVVSNRVSKIEHRKVFYRSNRKSSQSGRMSFDADVPVWPGVNVVTVVARQSGQVMSSQTLVVNRQRPADSPVGMN